MMKDGTRRRAELADFLKTRRARLHPEQFGLPDAGRRRTPGLRREEVAQLAGVGVSWYTWLEQGRAITVSDPVVESLVQVLQLNPEERRHLFLLARGMVPEAIAYQKTDVPLASHQAVLDALDSSPAYMLDERRNIVAWNTSACYVFGDFSLLSEREQNMIWSLFTRPSLRTFYVQWEKVAQQAVRSFRTIYDRHAGELWFEQLLTDLEEASPEFRTWWSQHDIQQACDPVHEKLLDHPQLGRLVLSSTTLVAPDAPTLQMIIFTARSQDTEAKLAAFGKAERSRLLAR